MKFFGLPPSFFPPVEADDADDVLAEVLGGGILHVDGAGYEAGAGYGPYVDLKVYQLARRFPAIDEPPITHPDRLKESKAWFLMSQIKAAPPAIAPKAAPPRRAEKALEILEWIRTQPHSERQQMKLQEQLFFIFQHASL